MPWINGRYYMNPFYGRALEKARLAEEGRVWSEEPPELEVRRSGTRISVRITGTTIRPADRSSK